MNRYRRFKDWVATHLQPITMPQIVASVSFAIYAIGLIVVNMYLGLFGVVSWEVASTGYILAGLGFVAYTSVLFMTPLVILAVLRMLWSAIPSTKRFHEIGRWPNNETVRSWLRRISDKQSRAGKVYRCLLLPRRVLSRRKVVRFRRFLAVGVVRPCLVTQPYFAAVSRYFLVVAALGVLVAFLLFVAHIGVTNVVALFRFGMVLESAPDWGDRSSLSEALLVWGEVYGVVGVVVAAAVAISVVWVKLLRVFQQREADEASDRKSPIVSYLRGIFVELLGLGLSSLGFLFALVFSVYVVWYTQSVFPKIRPEFGGGYIRLVTLVFEEPQEPFPGRKDRERVWRDMYLVYETDSFLLVSDSETPHAVTSKVVQIPKKGVRVDRVVESKM